jgi:hypothetical protein
VGETVRLTHTAMPSFRNNRFSIVNSSIAPATRRCIWSRSFCKSSGWVSAMNVVWVISSGV